MTKTILLHHVGSVTVLRRWYMEIKIILLASCNELPVIPVYFSYSLCVNLVTVKKPTYGSDDTWKMFCALVLLLFIHV